jgi:DNA-binding response OmpR family regulator
MACLRILVVDDDADTANLVRVICEMDGHEARSLTSGAAALETVRTFSPHVGIFDIAMPGMSGLELAAAVRREAQHTHLIALSGWARAEDAARSLAAGFHAHLAKPLSIDELRARLAAIGPAQATAC